MKRALVRQLAGFLISGGLAFLVDAGLYALLLGPWGTFWAKQTGFVAATAVSFFLNRTLSFNVPTSPLRISLFVGYYTVMAWLNPVLNEGFIAAWGNKPVAFVLTVAVTSVLNFLILKFVVFKGVRS